MTGSVRSLRSSSWCGQTPAEDPSGKILRGTMVKIADGESIKVPATIDDPAILDEIRAVLLGDGMRLNRQ